MNNSALVNPQLEGEAFFWPGGDTGVLLVHGFTATAAEVRPFASFLLEHGFTVGGPLLPGHGTTPQDLNQTSWKEWIASTEAVFQQLQKQCKRVIVGGESAGAVISLYLASQHPEISLLLLYAPAIRLNLSWLQALEMHLLALFGISIPKGGLDASSRWQGYRVNPLKGVLQLLSLQEEVKKCLSSIHQPLLVVQGCKDTTIHPTSGEIILKGVSSTVKELHWFENSSHVVLIDQESEQIARLSLEFIEKYITD